MRTFCIPVVTLPRTSPSGETSHLAFQLIPPAMPLRSRRSSSGTATSPDSQDEMVFVL